MGGLLDHFHRHEGLRAVLPLLSADAVEVRVAGAVLAAGEADAESAAAVAAEEASFEVVRVRLGLLPGNPPGSHDGLDSLEGSLINQGLVAALVEDAFVTDHAEVVAVAEQLVDGAEAQRVGWPVAGLLSLETPALQFFGQFAEGVVAAGVGGKGPVDQRSPLRVDHDSPDLPAFDSVPGRQVADGRLVGGAAELGLLSHALLGFGGQVVGVVLGEVGHDVTDQLAVRGVIDVLAGRRKPGAGRPDNDVDLDVVPAVASQPVDLVNDDQVDILLFPQPLEHLLQLGSFGGLGGFASIHITVHHRRAELVGQPVAGFALGGQGVALGVVVGVGLLLGRDTQVDDGPLGGTGAA